MNLYFAGSSHTLSSQWIIENNLNRLLSQEINRTEIDKITKLRKDGSYTGHILIDSGAFTAHRQGIEIDVDEYIDYINSISEYIDVYAQVDKIPGEFGKPKTQEQLLSAPQESWDNYLYMRPKMKEPDKLMPIYHQGESVKWLENMLEATFDGKHIPYIGISPANDKSQAEKNRFIDTCFSIIRKSSNPNVQTHAYGMTNLSTLSKYPFTSADSTSWALTAVNGSIMTPWGNTPLSAQNTNSGAFRGRPPAEQQAIREHIASKGFDIDNMIEASEDIVISRIAASSSLSPEDAREVLHSTVPRKPSKSLLLKKHESIQQTGKTLKTISPEDAEVVKFEKGRSIKGEFEYKAYLERIHWNILYLRDWAASHAYVPDTMRRKNLLHT